MRWNNRRTLLLIGICCCAAISCGPRGGFADPPAADPTAPPAAAETKAPGDAKTEPKADTANDPDVKFLTPAKDLWINKKKHQVGFTGKVFVREGNLEMLACPAGTKEYESIIGANIRAAFPVHAALLAVGAESGNPPRYEQKTGKFHPAKGSEIEVLIRWTDAKGAKHEVRGQDWVRDRKTGKSVDLTWVFGGSVLSVDPDTGEKTYAADGGDMISVVNFPDTMMDLAVESPAKWEDHLFEPFTDNIPPKGTAVEVVLTPKLEKKGKPESGKGDKPAEQTPAPSKPAADAPPAGK